MLSIASALALLSIASVRAQLRPGAANGPTNPAQPSLGTPLNQTSDARLISLNAYDDFCLFGPPEYRAETTTDANGQVQYESSIGNVEPIVVAWCTQQRNNARLIPDGVIQSAHFVKTPSYVQIRGFGDLTQLNIPYGDYGGELDPHGATNQGNPHGGNATTNVTGSDTFWGEWMMFVSYNQFCLRICTAEPNFPAPVMCEHKLDVMGCDFVMPGTVANGSFTSCDGDDALPPGVYPVSGGGYSTFAQRYTGTYTDNGTPVGYTVGVTSTPSAAFSVPASSNCVTHSTVANGVAAVQMNPDFNQGALTATTDGTVRPTASASGSEAAASGSEKASGTGTNTRAAASGTRATTTGTGTASTARNSSEPATGSASSTATAPLSVLLFTVVASLFVTGAFAIVA